MCGRYYVDDDIVKEIRRIAKPAAMDFTSGKTDIYPSQEAVVLVGSGGALAAVPMRWGFPQYNGKGLLINARAETALEKPAFRDSLLRRRCVIPAGGFYEWNKAKEKVDFYKNGVPILYMAGFYDVFQGVRRFVILTTSANASVAPVHDRMPLLLEEAELKDWIYDESFMRQTLHKTPLILDRRQEYEQQTFSFLSSGESGISGE